MKRKDMEDIIIIGNLADEYGDKSGEEIFVEIIMGNGEMGENMSDEQYEAIFEKLEDMRSEFNEEENEKLDKVLEILNKDR